MSDKDQDKKEPPKEDTKPDPVRPDPSFIDEYSEKPNKDTKKV